MTESENTMTMLAELRAVDEALESGAASSRDALERELQELTLALRAQAPEPSPEFAARLRARVRGGFPRERRLPGPLRFRPRMPKLGRSPLSALPRIRKLRRPPLAVLGGVASVLVALTVVVSLQGSGEDGPVGGGNAAVPAVRSPRSIESDGKATLEPAPGSLQGAKPQADSAAPSIAPEPPNGGGGFAPGERERRIERAASLTLAAPDDRLDRVADGIVRLTDGIVRLTDRYDGFVLRSSLSTGDDGTTGGDFELRIPADRLQAAVGDLSKLADVRARNQSGQDVTPEFVSDQEHLQAARAERRSLLRRLERAPTDSAAESIRRRLDLNAGEIRGLRGQIRDLGTRTNYAKVTVALQADGADDGASSPGSGDGLSGAVDDALGSLSDSVEITIRMLGVILPLGLLAAAVGLGGRAVRRRRREAALG